MKNTILLKKVPLKGIAENLHKQQLIDLDQTIRLRKLLLIKQFTVFTLTLDMYGFTLNRGHVKSINYNNKSTVNVIQKENICIKKC